MISGILDAGHPLDHEQFSYVAITAMNLYLRAYIFVAATNQTT